MPALTALFRKKYAEARNKSYSRGPQFATALSGESAVLRAVSN